MSRKLVWNHWTEAFRTTPLLRSSYTPSRLIFKACWKQYSTYLPTSWQSNYGTVENELNTSLRKGAKLGLKYVSKTGLEDLKISLQNDGSLHVKSSYAPWRPVFETMKTCCKHNSTVLKRASRLCVKTSIKLVWRALETIGSVNVFKSSYTSSRLVFKMSLSDICEDVLQQSFNHFNNVLKTLLL